MYLDILKKMLLDHLLYNWKVKLLTLKKWIKSFGLPKIISDVFGNNFYLEKIMYLFSKI